MKSGGGVGERSRVLFGVVYRGKMYGVLALLCEGESVGFILEVFLLPLGLSINNFHPLACW